MKSNRCCCTDGAADDEETSGEWRGPVGEPGPGAPRPRRRGGGESGGVGVEPAGAIGAASLPLLLR